MKFYFVLLSSMLFKFSFAQQNLSMEQTFKEYINSGITSRDFTKSSRSMMSFNLKQETEGSPYLLNSWAKGIVYFKNKTALSEPTYILNFDKMNNKLIMKVSDDQVLEIDMDKIDEFSLTDNANNTFTLSRLPQTGNTYTLELYKDSLFSLYKTLNTKFYKSDYVNKGLYETGYKYDRYVDENKYYILRKDKTFATLQKIDKPELKELLKAHPAIKNFMKENNSPSQNESKEKYMTNLVTWLSKNQSSD